MRTAACRIALVGSQLKKHREPLNPTQGHVSLPRGAKTAQKTRQETRGLSAPLVPEVQTIPNGWLTLGSPKETFLSSQLDPLPLDAHEFCFIETLCLGGGSTSDGSLSDFPLAKAGSVYRGSTGHFEA